MYHRIWLIANGLLIVGSFLYIWFFRPHVSSLIIFSQFLAMLAMIFFIINVNMYFIFLIIRKTKQREIKIWLATFSRYMMKSHIKIAISSTILIVGHAFINLFHMGPVIGYLHIKMLLGYSAFLLLCFTLFAGYLRHKKASGFRKKFHRVLAFIFTVLFLVHMLIPI